jgi:hypothetical protein
VEPCTICGQPVRSTSRFCSSCGYRVPEHSSTAAPASSSGLASSWPAPAVETVETVEVVGVPLYAALEVVADPIDEIIAATAGFNEVGDSLVDVSLNKINVALYHVESIRQMVPDLSAWSEERAQLVNSAIAALEAALKGREADDNTFYGLRQTVVAAKRDPRDIDTMIALSDRSMDSEDLLKAHDKYSIGVRTALIDLKPLAVEYVRVPKKRRAPARRTTTSRSRSTTSRAKTATTAAV